MGRRYGPKFAVIDTAPEVSLVTRDQIHYLAYENQRSATILFNGVCENQNG